MKKQDLLNKKILIAGYGVEGVSTKKWLQTFLPVENITVIDNIDKSANLIQWENFDLAIKSPGIEASKIKIPYTTATNIFMANVSPIHKIIGVTGTKGKSTTSSMIFHILKERGLKTRLIGNIGNPMIECLIKKDIEPYIYVAEFSSYMLADINFSPHIAVYVSLFPDHLNYHHGVLNYYNAKKRMSSFAQKKDFFVYNPRFKEFTQWAKTVRSTVIPLNNSLSINNIKTIGDHNIENAKIAVTVTSILNVSKADAINALATFNPLPHRLQNLGVYNGITFIDDAISTTPESTIAGIEALNKVDAILLGGENRGYYFSNLVNCILKKGIKFIVLFPDSSIEIKKELEKQGFKNSYIFETNKMSEAVDFVFKKLKPYDLCLLSCASPSYSLWKNYEEKGDEFKKYILEYVKA